MERSLHKVSFKRPVFNHPVEPEYFELRRDIGKLVSELSSQKQKLIWMKALFFPTAHMVHASNTFYQ